MITKSMIDTTTPTDIHGTQHALATNVRGSGALVSTYSGVEEGTGDIVLDMAMIPGNAGKSFSSVLVDIYGRVVGGIEGFGVTVPVATTTSLGCVIVGAGLTVDSSGVLSAPNLVPYILPKASSTSLGGVKVGSGLDMDIDGVVSVTTTYVLPVATDAVLGGIRLGDSLMDTGSGVVDVVPASETNLGGIRVDANSGLVVDVLGKASVSKPPSPIPGPTHIVSDSDINRFLVCDSSSPISITLPNETSIVSGSGLEVMQKGSGSVSFLAASEAEILCSGTPNTRTQYSVVCVRKIANGSWSVFGDVAA